MAEARAGVAGGGGREGDGDGGGDGGYGALGGGGMCGGGEGLHICAPTLGEALTTLMRMGDMAVLDDAKNKHRGVNLSLDQLTTGLEAATSAIAEVDRR